MTFVYGRRERGEQCDRFSEPHVTVAVVQQPVEARATQVLCDESKPAVVDCAEVTHGLHMRTKGIPCRVNDIRDSNFSIQLLRRKPCRQHPGNQQVRIIVQQEGDVALTRCKLSNDSIASDRSKRFSLGSRRGHHRAIVTRSPGRERQAPRVGESAHSNTRRGGPAPSRIL
jgi:hypothetical protein